MFGAALRLTLLMSSYTYDLPMSTYKYVRTYVSHMYPLKVYCLVHMSVDEYVCAAHEVNVILLHSYM